tara:strand:+ start:6086 stop:6535 length:450 start_codon:yes stop_codon:yes gene_type:complete
MDPSYTGTVYFLDGTARMPDGSIVRLIGPLLQDGGWVRSCNPHARDNYDHDAEYDHDAVLAREQEVADEYDRDAATLLRLQTQLRDREQKILEEETRGQLLYNIRCLLAHETTGMGFWVNEDKPIGDWCYEQLVCDGTGLDNVRDIRPH